MSPLEASAAKLDALAMEQQLRPLQYHAGPQWPKLDPLAFYGPVGDLVRLIEPHSEADPVGLLLQGLVAFGSMVGRGPHFSVEGAEHHGNLFVALVGETAKGRKGTSWTQVLRALRLVESRWADTRVAAGLSSGEGLIWQVRDPVYKHERDKRTSRLEEVLDDPGIGDKRLCVVEAELAQTLKVMARQGNTLSPTLRCAWETGCLTALTKNSQARATGAHISIIGHVTRDELLRCLGETEAASGFANRFIWLLVRRSKCLPDGGQLDREDLRPLATRLAEALNSAREVQEVRRDEDARLLWHSIYPALSEGKPGLLGSVLARGEAQLMRLALLYALADGTGIIGCAHLLAATALWDYAEASARYIFGDALGDPTADEIIAALRLAPGRELSRSDIGSLFHRSKPSAEIGRALAALEAKGLVRCRLEETGGRPRQVWTLIADFSDSAGVAT